MKRSSKVVLLGGYGAMAQVIARDLVENTAVDEIVIAGRDAAKAKAFATVLSSLNKKKRVTSAAIDVTDKNLVSKLRLLHATALINATWYEHNLVVMKAVLASGIKGYVDLGGLYWKTLDQLKLHAQAKAAGVTCVLGMGSTPGITNVMTAYGSRCFDRIDSVKVRCGSALLGKPVRGGAFSSPYSIKTILDEFTKKPIVLRGGKIKEIDALSLEDLSSYTAPIGTVLGYATLHSELATLPTLLRPLGIKEMDFAVAYDPEFTSVVASLVKAGMASHDPVSVGGCDITPYDMLVETIRRLPVPPTPPPDIECLRIAMQGSMGGKKRHVLVETWSKYHLSWKQSAGSVDTGVPASIVGAWLACRVLDVPGVHPPEAVIAPEAFFKELSRKNRGMHTHLIINGKRTPLA